MLTQKGKFPLYIGYNILITFLFIILIIIILIQNILYKNN